MKGDGVKNIYMQPAAGEENHQAKGFISIVLIFLNHVAKLLPQAKKSAYDL